MALTLDQAASLDIGAILKFHTDDEYEVIGMTVYKNTININLRRVSDGLETFANEHMLYKAEIVSRPDADTPPQTGLDVQIFTQPEEEDLFVWNDVATVENEPDDPEATLPIIKKRGRKKKAE